MMTSQPSGETRRLDLTAVQTAPYKAREFTRVALRAWLVPPDEVRVTEIVVSELVTNAVRASGAALDRPPGLSVDGLRADDPGTAEFEAGDPGADDAGCLSADDPGAVEFGADDVSADRGADQAYGENISLTLRLLPSEVVVEVADNNPALPVSSTVGPDAESGRGLMIVDGLSKVWGHKPGSSGGKVVYAVLAITRREGA